MISPRRTLRKAEVKPVEHLQNWVSLKKNAERKEEKKKNCKQEKKRNNAFENKLEKTNLKARYTIKESQPNFKKMPKSNHMR